METGQFKIISELYQKEEMYGFIIPDIITALSAGIAGWILMNIIPFFFGVIAILIFRNMRMNRPKGYFLHLMYHYGYYYPLKTIPPGEKICNVLFE